MLISITSSFSYVTQGIDAVSKSQKGFIYIGAFD